MALGGSRGHPEWHGPSDSTPTGIQVVVQTLGLCMNLMVTRAIIINTDPGCCRVKDPNMAPATTLIDQIVVCATEIYMAPDSAWPWALTWSLVAKGSTDVNSIPGCYGFLSSSLGLDDNVARMAIQVNPISVALAVAWCRDTYMDSGYTWARYIPTDSGCGRATNSGMALGSKVDLDFTMALSCKRTFHISLFLTASSFLQFQLFTQHVDDYTSLSLPFLCHILAHHNGPIQPQSWGPRLAYGWLVPT